MVSSSCDRLLIRRLALTRSELHLNVSNQRDRPVVAVHVRCVHSVLWDAGATTCCFALAAAAAAAVRCGLPGWLFQLGHEIADRQMRQAGFVFRILRRRTSVIRRDRCCRSQLVSADTLPILAVLVVRKSVFVVMVITRVKK